MRVAVLAGGRSSEHEVSLASGESVRGGLRDGGHELVEVKIERGGAWVHEGEALALKPGEGVLGTDVVFPVLHGPFGEDGTVLRQSPTQGSKVDKGATVTIVVAKEPTRVAVPGVVGQDQASAASALSGAGLTVITRTQETDDETQDGMVVDQDPAQGDRVPKGSRVTIFVGRYVAPPDPGTPETPGQ